MPVGAELPEATALASFVAYLHHHVTIVHSKTRDVIHIPHGTWVKI